MRRSIAGSFVRHGCRCRSNRRCLLSGDGSNERSIRLAMRRARSEFTKSSVGRSPRHTHLSTSFHDDVTVLAVGRHARAGVWRRVACTATAVLVLALVGSGAAFAAPSGRSLADRGAGSSGPALLRADGVTAILLDSYDRCTVDQAWSTLNADWAEYGSVPVSIGTGGRLCSGPFTLADLEASGADTVIVADTAWWYRWTTPEVDALQDYVEQGHTLLGLGLDFMFHRHNDTALAPLFGLAKEPLWKRSGLGQRVYKLRPRNPVAPVLFRDVSDPYASSGPDFAQQPSDGQWKIDDLAGATFAGVSRHRRAAITAYEGTGYPAIYISSAAWFQSTATDLQFLYNALIYPTQG